MKRHAFAIVAYRDSPFLRQCVASILAQEQGQSEVLITTSTPTAAIADAGRHFSVPVVVNPERVSIGADWNFALAASSAELVTIAHQDDVYRPSYAASMRQVFDLHPKTLIAFSDFEEHTELGPRKANLNVRVKRYLTRRAFGSRDVIATAGAKRRLLAWGNPICCPSVVVNRALVPDLRFDADMASNLDWEAWTRLADIPGDFAYVRRQLVSKMVHGGSETSVALGNQRRQREDLQMFERFWPAPLAHLIGSVYRIGYLSNRV